jgi:hypothetical protein
MFGFGKTVKFDFAVLSSCFAYPESTWRQIRESQGFKVSMQSSSGHIELVSLVSLSTFKKVRIKEYGRELPDRYCDVEFVGYGEQEIFDKLTTTFEKLGGNTWRLNNGEHLVFAQGFSNSLQIFNIFQPMH